MPSISVRTAHNGNPDKLLLRRKPQRAYAVQGRGAWRARVTLSSRPTCSAAKSATAGLAGRFVSHTAAGRCHRLSLPTSTVRDRLMSGLVPRTWQRYGSVNTHRACAPYAATNSRHAVGCFASPGTRRPALLLPPSIDSR